VLGILVGFGSGLLTGIVLVYYGEWLRSRRSRRKQGAELIARIRLLLDDANPKYFMDVENVERNRAHVRTLFERWDEMREEFHVFGEFGSAELRKPTKEVGLSVPVMLRALYEAGTAKHQVNLVVAKSNHAKALQGLDALSERL
jgi:hypothetical protein